MKIPFDIALWLQFNLYLTTLDGYSPDSFLYGKEINNNSMASRWQLVVDTIYRCLTCELIYICNRICLNVEDVKNKSWLINGLAYHEPFGDDFFENGITYWIGPLLCSTERCESLIDKYDIKKFEGNTVCRPFIDEIELIFERHGVGWSENPLIPIKQQA